MSETFVFIVAAALILVGGIGVVAAKNPVHSALFLIQTLIGVAVLFVVQDAHFLAAVQIIVYAGAIVILFLFVIMLLGVDTAEDWQLNEPIAGQQPLAAIVGASLLGIGIVVTTVATDDLTGAVRRTGDRALDSDFTDVERIGRVLFSDYAMSFEITAALLTIAVIGAVVLTRTVLSGDVLDELQPADMELPPLAPYGGNDSDLASPETSADAASEVDEAGSRAEAPSDGRAEAPSDGRAEAPSDGRAEAPSESSE